MVSYARFFRSIFAGIAAAALVLTGPGMALAGTTGGISGIVTDRQTGKPLADTVITIVSASQSATATSNAAGHYVFVSLMPDTYTLTAKKSGYEPLAIAGISVFADQTQTVQVVLQNSLRTIASVTSRSSLSPVKPGVTTDVYSVNPALTQAAAPIGGGGALNNAYSAIASMPGAYVPSQQAGDFQDVYIRGGNYDQLGYEYDGVPMNRSFDNYPSHSASTLGQQELQIYTGGGPASSNATGLAGFINQVVKSGTFPGYGNISARIGTPAFYHDISFEAGGASPNRLFSYYAGVSGYNQDFRYLTQDNGAGLANQFPEWYPSYVTTNLPFWPAVYPTCNATSVNNFYNNPALDNNPGLWEDPGCFSYLGPNEALQATMYGREAVANVHFGIPHHNDGGRDDIQLLYTNSYQLIQNYTEQGVLNPLFSTMQQNLYANNGEINLGPYAYPAMWPDFYTFPSSTGFMQPANVPVIAYAFPGSPANRCYNTNWTAGSNITVPNECPAGSTGFPGTGNFSPLPSDYRDGELNQASIVKLQYQKNIGSRAYLRLFGYTFYSNTSDGSAIIDGITGPYGPLNVSGYRTNYNYEIDSHTRGGQLQFADQINDTNQLSATLNYVTASTLRYYNYNDYNIGGPPANDYTGSGGMPVSNLTNGTQCFAAYSGLGANGIDNYNAGQVAPCNDPISQGSFDDLTGNADYGSTQNQNCSGGPNAAIPTGACAAGASWRMTYLGNFAQINQITPKFTNFSLSDEFKPNDKLDISASVRFDRDEFDLVPVDTDPGKNFWYASAQKEFCYNPKTLQPALIPEPPQYLYDVKPYVSFSCPVDPADGIQTVHPDGQNGHILLTDKFNPTYVQNYFTPLFGMTYTMDRYTVLRLSAGRYAQEPQNYEIEYNSAEPNLAAELVGFLQYGFFTPFHPATAQFSNNYDFSIEHEFPKTDIAMKVTPYYRYATQQLDESVGIPTLSVSPSFNGGTEQVYGVELQITKGDFNKNGFSGQLAYTYTNAKEKWSNWAGTPINAVDPYNQDIAAYNALTKAGGGSPCYNTSSTYNDSLPAVGETCPSPATATSFDIMNPYYNQRSQPLLDRNGWYEPGLSYGYLSPNTFALILNYKHDKLAITPAFTLSQGVAYGSPDDVQGYDPRTCYQNQGPSGANIASAPNPLTADYTSCKHAAVGASGTSPGHLYIPNPYSGTFDSFGQFRNPWQLTLGMQVRYDISPRITANLTATNLYYHCFGGSSEPWTSTYPPGSHVCGYDPNRFFISNYYNGSSPNDVAANGVPLNTYFSRPFVPAYTGTDYLNLGFPLQLYFQLQIKV
ncbi:MAG TPA: TonB-dependent receptor [Candidatus Baltobacteraceae bacterium]|jgi:hypothetical protein|nr:TonB-dependent receptor [Candidatus Baltobacteraceae bacterium]